jgi:16S rRNA (cytosine967-C5)-methyltransferase
MTKANPRAVALDLLQAVLRRRRPLDEALAGHPLMSRLEPRDRGFARLLVATTLRRLGEIDLALAPLIARPLPAKADAISDVLRLGACQLLFLNTPPHAAVGESVALLGGLGALGGGYRGLVNAVLRRLDRERPVGDPTSNTPAWLLGSWTAAYGTETAAAIAAAHLVEAPLDVSVKNDPAGWATRLGAEILPTGSLRLPAGGTIESLPGFGEGGWWVQDAAAALPARLLGQPAHAVDLCAAPGGKTAQLAAAGIEVVAVDRSAQRLARLGENLRRLELSATIVEANAATWRPETPAEAVLLDAPCSATGTIRRHPDLPWLKAPEDLAKLTALQDRLLANAVAMTRPGGLIVYATCSLQPEEGIERIEALLAGGAPVERVAIRPEEVGGMGELLTEAGDLRSLPCHLAGSGGMDGFYTARLRRTSQTGR